ncbi:MAG: SUMF1/EgtB/PvdO family nonheme iron enzyme [Bryobacteraceae bacterium]
MRFLITLAACAAVFAQPQVKEAGVCSRCHVAQVLEWSTSKHASVKIACQGCHGASAGHVANERNEVKPDRLPRGAALAQWCSTCHAKGCPKTAEAARCESCHHPHALISPVEKKLEPLEFRDEARLAAFTKLMAAGDAAVSRKDWPAARGAFREALAKLPGNRRATARLAMTERRLNPRIEGFEIEGDAFDAETGLPRNVRVAGLGIAMVLVPGGDADMGSSSIASASPVHTVTVAPFYLARFELMQQEWRAIDKEDPSTVHGAKLPVHNVSWRDADQWIAKLNAKVAGGGFRLPSEAEWEWAARGSEAGWHREDSGSGTGTFRELNTYAPHEVGARPANPLGLHDMLGNVWEWCSTLLRPYPYDAGDGREDAASAGLRVLRGGGYGDPAQLLDPAFRHGERPDRQQPFNGMRLARSAQ